MLSKNLMQNPGPKKRPRARKKPIETVEQKETSMPENLSTPIINEQDQFHTINNEAESYKESNSEPSEQLSSVEKSAQKISESDHSDIIEGDDSVGDQNTIINP